MNAREIARRNLAWEIRAKGCTATATDGRTVKGLYGPRKEDPVALQMEGVDNVATPNRYQFRAIDDAHVVREGEDLTILGQSHRVVDVDQLAATEGAVGIRATLLLLGDR